MQVVTPADREAARALREALADVSGFWYRLDDEGPLCQAIARHRIQAEQRVLRQAFPEAQAIPLTLDKTAKPAEQPSPGVQRLLGSLAAVAPASGINYGG